MRLGPRKFPRLDEFSGTTDHWLVGQRLDTKSNLCPKSVKSLSNVCRKTGKVQGLSNGCLESVKCLSNAKALGQSLDMEIQGLSRQYQMEIMGLKLNKI